MTTEAEKYNMLWSRDEGYGNNYEIPKGRELVEFVHMVLGLHGDETILDIGGGDGRLKEHWPGHEVTTVDIAEASEPDIVADISEWSDPGAYDVGICFDVMEHLPPEQVAAAIRNIAATCDKVAFVISTRPDRFGARIGMPLHLTVKNAAWWVLELRKRFGEVELRRKNSDYCVITAERDSVR